MIRSTNAKWATIPCHHHRLEINNSNEDCVCDRRCKERSEKT